jgi:hypothetical protein
LELREALKEVFLFSEASLIYPYNKQVLVAWLVGDNLLLRNFGPYGIICVCCYNPCHGNAVKDFGVLWDIIYNCVFTTLDFPVILDGQSSYFLA